MENINIPTSLKKIGNSVFEYCSKLGDVTLNNGLESIECYAFSGCVNIYLFKIPNSVTSIGEGTFSGCNHLIDIELSDNMTEIEAYLFSGCDVLSNIKIPAKVVSIGDYAFKGCKHLEMFGFKGGNVVTFHKNVFKDCSSKLYFASSRNGYQLETYENSKMTNKITPGKVNKDLGETIYLKWIPDAKYVINEPEVSVEEESMMKMMVSMTIVLINIALLKHGHH